MSVRRILVLANSIKTQARCVAGREVLALEGGHIHLGEWIRPISRRDEGALQLRDLSLRSGGVVSVLDIVEVSLAEHAADPGQPENHYVEYGSRWDLVGRVPAAHLEAFTETPSDLWPSTDRRSDRISVLEHPSASEPRSLALIEPCNLRFNLWSETNPFKGYTQLKTRAIFGFAGHLYDMSLTDPVFSAVLPRHPLVGEPQLTWTPPEGFTCRLCISLTPPFKGYHYKVVATVIPLGPLPGWPGAPEVGRPHVEWSARDLGVNEPELEEDIPF